uniref:Uncharacterized protein n=1 Tax=Octactis speculum TaxID=3111310 RepID=A0A7S2GFU8_9STRA|mmetsp:Transcript_47121/g.64169  ORF Transcript_47121/g.64169 Transcript_47121/m.64169 type:complete len:119 (+) Transcript_47121:40-396(+)
MTRLAIQLISLALLVCSINSAGFETCLRERLIEKNNDLSRSDVVSCSGLDSDDQDTCELKCTLEAIGVYWACAVECIVNESPDACILTKCPAEVVAYDIPCLNVCTNTTKLERSTLIV